MHHFAQLDADGVIVAVFAQSSPEPDPSLPGLVPLPTWEGWQSGQRARWVNDQVQWEPTPLAQRQAAARAQRDQLLAACDWVALRAVEQAQPVPTAWASYRQALRDVPAQAGFPDDITWPTAPA